MQNCITTYPDLHDLYYREQIHIYKHGTMKKIHIYKNG